MGGSGSGDLAQNARAVQNVLPGGKDVVHTYYYRTIRRFGAKPLLCAGPSATRSDAGGMSTVPTALSVAKQVAEALAKALHALPLLAHELA